MYLVARHDIFHVSLYRKMPLGLGRCAALTFAMQSSTDHERDAPGVLHELGTRLLITSLNNLLTRDLVARLNRTTRPNQ